MNWNQNLPMPVARKLMKHETPVNHTPKLPVATLHAKSPVARTNTEKHTNTSEHYITVNFTVVFGGAHIRITRFPVNHWTPDYITNGRNRKKVAQNWREHYVEIDNSKQENLANLVKELESEQKTKHKKSEQEKQYHTDVMIQYARLQSYDYHINLAADEYDINDAMVKHFNKLEQNLLNNFAQYANLIAARKATWPVANKTKKQKPNNKNPKDNKYMLAAKARYRATEARQTKYELNRYRGVLIESLFDNNNQM